MLTRAAFLLSVLALALAGCGKEDTEDTEDTTDTQDTQDTQDTEDSSVQIDIDETYVILDGEDHQKNAFDMPEGIGSLTATMTWSDAAWAFALDLGEGTCPHSGTTYVSGSGDAGEIILTLDASELDAETLPAGAWFSHVGVSSTDHDLGDTEDYSIHIELFPVE